MTRTYEGGPLDGVEALHTAGAVPVEFFARQAGGYLGRTRVVAAGDYDIYIWASGAYRWLGRHRFPASAGDEPRLVTEVFHHWIATDFDDPLEDDS